MIRRATGMCAALIGLAAEQSAAGSFSVSPTRIELGPSQRVAVLTLHNADSAPLTVQASLMNWSQDAGQDQYAETHDLLGTPPVFTLPPNGDQIVRIALRRPADARRELPYRIFFQEVPQQSQPGFSGLNVALRIGLPIFVSPTGAADARLRWQMRRLEDGSLQVEAVNDSGAHVQVTDFQLTLNGAPAPLASQAAKYVLPGGRVSWRINAPAAAAQVAALAGARIAGNSDQGQFATDVALVPGP